MVKTQGQPVQPVANPLASTSAGSPPPPERLARWRPGSPSVDDGASAAGGEGGRSPLRGVRRPGVWLAVLIVVGAAACVLVAHPAVDTFELQRRDRLANQAAQPQGDQSAAPRASVDGETGPPSGVVDRAALRAQVPDGYGRVGFVVLIAVAMGLLLLLDARSRRPTVASAAIFVPTGLIVGLFSACAVTWLAYDHLVLDAFSRGKFGYLEWLTQVTTLSATNGIWNVWTPYPQGTQEVIVGLQLLANALGSLTTSDVWTSYTFFRLGFQLTFLVLPSIASLWLASRLAHSFGPTAQTLVVLSMALSFGVIYYGAASAYVTDPLPVAVTLAAMLAIARRRFGLAGVLIGCGAALKLFPILIVPALLFLLPRTALPRLLASCAATLAVAFGPGLLANPQIFLSPWRWQTTRPPWESWYAFASWLTDAPHEYLAPYFQDASAGIAFGWVFTGITPLLSVLQSPVPPGPWRWENVVSVGGSVLLLSLCASARSRSPRALVRWCLFCVAGFLVFGIGWSPQYELYLIPLVVLAFDDPMVGVGAALLLQAATFLDYPLLLPWAYFYGGSAVWLDWAAVLSRYLVLGWLCLVVLRLEGSRRALFGRLRAFRRWVPAAAALPVTVALLLVPTQATDVSAADDCATAATAPQAPLPLVASNALDWPRAGGHFFTQAGGFSIVDDADANFWSEFQRLGGPGALGYPSSRRFMWHGRVSQATQRAVLQWSPVTGQVEFANLLDLLHDSGFDDALSRADQIPPPSPVDEVGLQFETIAQRRLQWLDERPAIKRAYCAAPGGMDPLELWGLPTSQAIDVADPGTVYVVRTQRAAFQEWVDGAVWAAPGQVTVALAGDLAKKYQLLPSEAQTPEPPPPRF